MRLFRSKKKTTQRWRPLFRKKAEEKYRTLTEKEWETLHKKDLTCEIGMYVPLFRNRKYSADQIEAIFRYKNALETADSMMAHHVNQESVWAYVEKQKDKLQRAFRPG